MNASTRYEAISLRRLARATLAVGAIALVVLGANTLPARATSTVAKSRFAEIGTGATRVVVQVNRGLNAKTDRYSHVTTTNPATIDTIIDHVNALPAAPSADEMCPMDVGAKLTLSFYRHAATSPYAVVVADPGGCGPVSIRDYRANDTLIGTAEVGGGVAFSAYVAALLHIKTLQVS
jgi:hypothetical protein